jgi:uncharacterized Ntn-hydrolase superfamily protein
MTFSIVAFDPDSGDLGVAVQSKFPNAGVTIPYAQTGVGAIATQAYCNTSFGPRGLSLLDNGASPEQTVQILTQGDENRAYRQVGIIDVRGRTAVYTGERCFDWAGSVQGENFSVQGNVLAGPQVAEAMARAFREDPGELSECLLAALRAGQAAGGERRGQQSAGLLVVRQGGGYGGHDDRYAAISVYDHPTPITELERLYAIHRLTYFRSRPEDLIPITGDLTQELLQTLHERGFYRGSIEAPWSAEATTALHDFMGWENYDERIRDDGLIDREVLEDIRAKRAEGLVERQC